MSPSSHWVLALAEGDCETATAGLLGQPANTISSLALVVVGAWLVSYAHHEWGWRWGTLGVATIAAGIGSVAYHGPMPPTGQLLHDLGLVSMPLTVGAIEVGMRRRGLPSTLWVLLPTVVVAGVVLVLEPGLTNVLTAVTAVWAGIGVALAWVRGGRPVRALPWPPLVVLALTAGTGALLRSLGRTDGPLCEPTSLLQPHAAWHVLASVAVAAFAVAAYGIPTSTGGRRSGQRV